MAAGDTRRVGGGGHSHPCDGWQQRADAPAAPDRPQHSTAARQVPALCSIDLLAWDMCLRSLLVPAALDHICKDSKGRS